MSPNFSLDLVDLALKQLEFLQFIDNNKQFYEDGFLTNALQRYEQYWLPLYSDLIKQGQNPRDFYPPSDVAWVWHCHLLSPVDYINDCQTIVGMVPDHFVFSLDEIKSKQEKTKGLWQQRFTGIPFEQEGNSIVGPTQSKIQYDIVSSCKRQANFYYQVSLPHYRNRNYLEQCLDRYKKFLIIRQKNPNFFVVPSYAIDIMWHTHQLNHSVYEKETREFLSSMLPHDDSPNDRRPGTTLTQLYLKTREYWMQEFNENFTLPGGMYRGDAPHFSNVFSKQSSVSKIGSNEEVHFQIERSQFQNHHFNNISGEYEAFDLKNFDVSGSNGECIRAQHSIILNRGGQSVDVAQAEVLHVPSSQWSSVKIQNGTQLIATSHMIGLPQLPMESNTKDSSYPLNIDPRSEKAMLVRNAYGDAAIVKGKWVGFGANQSGELQVTVYNFRTKSVAQFNVPSNGNFQYEDDVFRADIDLKLDQVSFMLKEGKQGLESPSVVETLLATLFSIASLHVFLQPKRNVLSIGSNPLVQVSKSSEWSEWFMLKLIGYNELTHSDYFVDNNKPIPEKNANDQTEVQKKHAFAKKMNQWLYSTTETGIEVDHQCLNAHERTGNAHCGGCGGCGACRGK